MAQKKPSFAKLEQLVETGQATSEQEDLYYMMLRKSRTNARSSDFISAPHNGFHDMSRVA